MHEEVHVQATPICLLVDYGFRSCSEVNSLDDSLRPLSPWHTKGGNDDIVGNLLLGDFVGRYLIDRARRDTNKPAP